MDSLHQCILFCVFASLIFFAYLLSWSRRNTVVKSKGGVASVPEVDGGWPIIGHLHLLQPPTIPHRLYASLADKYGPIFALRTGLRKTVVVNNWEIGMECFVTNDKVFANRPKMLVAEILGFDYAMFGPSPYGPYWREMRKVAIIELLSNRRLEQLKHFRVREISTSIQELYQLCAGKEAEAEAKAVPAVMVDMRKWFSDLTLNIIVRMVAGKRYFGASSKEDAEEAKLIHKAVRDFAYLFGVFVISDVIPFLGWFDFQGHVKAMKRSAKEVGCIMDRWLEEHKQQRRSRSSSLVEGTTTDGDFMDVLLSVLEDKNLFGREADTVNKATCMNMIVGATDTNSVTLTWALSLLLNNRHILNKAQEEIDIHVGREKLVEESDIEKLVYLQAIIKETLRLFPTAPGPRETTEDCTLSGYHVPKGTLLLLNTWRINRDPRIWSCPDEFQPERFLTTHANADIRGQHSKYYAPFGLGRRSCPATSFALLVMHLTLARLLQGFHFSTPLDAPVELNGSVGLTNVKSTPLQVLITPRLPSHLY